MDQAFQTTHSCLPVTALHTLRLEQDLLILAGHGSFLSVIDAGRKVVLSRQRVFASSPIHGITSDSSPIRNDEPRPLLIWSRCLICFASLRILTSDICAPNAKLVVEEVEIGPTIHAPDWILDASFNYGPSSSEVPACLITAHNELVVLYFGRSQSSNRFRTNVLLRTPDLRRISPVGDQLLYSARLRCVRSNGSFLITAGTISGHLLHWSSQSLSNAVLNLSEVRTCHKGAIFGVDQLAKYFVSCSDDREVRLGWLDPSTTASDIPEVFRQRPSDTSHTAPVQTDAGSAKVVEVCKHGSRVWGAKLLAIGTDFLGLVSIGEDGVCQIWQIGRGEVIQLTRDHYHAGKNIWSVADGQLGGRHHVITGGADGAIVLREISRRYTSRGADTQEIARSPSKHEGAHLDHLQSELSPHFAKLKIRAVARSGSDAKPPSIKQYQFISSSCLLALTDSGYLLSYTENDSPVVEKPSNRDECAMSTDTLPLLSKWSFKRRFKTAFRERPVMSNSKDHLVFLGNGNGNLFTCFPEGNEDEMQKALVQLDVSISWLNIAGVKHVSDSLREYCIVTYSNSSEKAKVFFVFVSMGAEEIGLADIVKEPDQVITDRFRNSSNASFETKVYELDLPPGFEPTSAVTLYHTQALVLGSKQSGIAFYMPLGLENPYVAAYISLGERVGGYDLPFYSSPAHVPHVHGRDHVTSISGISSSEVGPDVRKDYFLTTGRNGMYSVHSIRLEENQLLFNCLDNSSTPFKSGIEGAYCAQTQKPQHESPGLYPRSPFWTSQWQREGAGRVKSGDLILYGFDSKKFLVWNESQRSLVFSIDCENAHRPWAYNTYAPTIGQGGLSLPTHGPGAWTQAQSLNLVTIGRPSHSLVQNGGHGREIKALSVYPLPYQDLRHGIWSGRLIVTGAEDTRIRFFVVSRGREDHAQNKIMCVRTIKQHTTGVQHLSFSSCGKFLFSSGGCEELYAWRIRQGVPGVNLGVQLAGTFPKEAKTSDLRITHFNVNYDERGKKFWVSAVYSNSMIKIFNYQTATRVSSESCSLWFRGFYLDKCIVKINDHTGNGTLIASTQGRCLTQIKEYATSEILTASTDGHLAFWPGRSDTPLFRHSVHQNSIKAMHSVDLVSQDPNQQNRLVITGGDDNALGLTLIRSASNFPTFHAPVFQSLLISSAHAASITAICVHTEETFYCDLFRPNGCYISFLTTGNDQRVKRWSVHVDFDRMAGGWGDDLGGPSMAAVQIGLLSDQPTEVADVGAMELVEIGSPHVPEPPPFGGDKTVHVLVVGIGMEVLQFRL